MVGGQIVTRSRLGRALLILLFIELGYLLLVNAALRLPLTQTLINDIRPEKFTASWGSAWSWYPFRVHVTDLSANGQSRSQQWQVEARQVSASIALLPLALKRVWISDVRVTDVEYRQRPRLKEGRDYSAVLAFFPEIDGREIVPAVDTPRKEKRPWHIAVDDIRSAGMHSFWIYQARGSASGELAADLTLQSRGGPFSLVGQKLDLQLEQLVLNGDHEVFSGGTVGGAFSFDPFVPGENRGAALLQFLSLDVEVDIDLNSLDFLNLFLLNFDGVSVDGSGQVAGPLRYRRGDVLSGTALSVAARNLLVNVMSHRVEGDGAVNLTLGPQSNEQFDLTFLYDNLEVHHDQGRGAVLTGQGLQLSVGGNGHILRDPGKPNPTRSLVMDIGHLTVPDMALLQRYFPVKWPFRFYAGSGSLRGRAGIAPAALAVDMTLISTGADLGIRDYRFDSNLEFALKLDNPSINTSDTEISGSYLRLSEARLRRSDEQQQDDWNAHVTINEGHIGRHDRDDPARQAQVVDLLRGLSEANSSEMLDQVAARLDFQADVSSLAWIGALFNEDYGINVGGSGSVDGLLRVASGWPAAGTTVAVKSEQLAVHVLDYVSRGDGEITLQVKEGESYPDWWLEIALADADFKRAEETASQIRDVTLNLSAVIPDVGFEKDIKASSLDFKILSATVTDMSTFNAYLPPDGPLRLEAGTADLAAAITLQPEDADGWLRLDSKGLAAVVARQSISADLALQVMLVDGTPADMVFDISGSTLRLDEVHVAGERAQFAGDYWSAVFELRRGKTAWTRPVRLDLEADLSVSDSRPVVAMFENQGRRPEFLSRMLTVKDIEGVADVQVADEQIRIFNAHATSDHLELGAKGLISAEEQDSVLYLRYKKADALLKFQDGGKNLDIIGVKKKFDDFRVAQPVPQGAAQAGGS